MVIPASKTPKMAQTPSHKNITDKDIQQYFDAIFSASKTNTSKQQKTNTQEFEKTQSSQKEVDAKKSAALKSDVNFKADLMKDTGRFGLNNSTQLMNLLNSEAGNRLKASIAKAIAEIEAMKLQSQREAEIRRLKYRMMAIAIFFAIWTKSAHAAKYRKAIQEFHDELNRLKKARTEHHPVETHKPTYHIDTPSVNIKDLQKFISLVQERKTGLEDRLADQEKVFSEILERHAIHEEAFEDVHSYLAENEIEFPVHDMEVAEDAPLPPLTEKSENHLQMLEDKIEKTQAESQELRSLMKDNEDMLDANHPVRCQAEACEHKIDMLRDMQDVIMGRGYFANAWGQQVSSPDEAHHVVARGYKVEFDNAGVPHRLKMGISLNELTPTERLEAQQDHQANSKIFRPALIRKANQQEVEEHSMAICSTMAKISLCDEEIDKANRQIKQLQTRPQPVDPDATVRNTVTPKPTPGNRVSKPAIEYKNQISSFRNHTLREVQQRIEAKDFPEDLRNDARDFLDSLRMKPGDQMSPNMLKNLEQHLSDVQQRRMAGIQPMPSPTPFNTRPR